RVLAAPEICLVAGERDPAVRADTPSEDRPHVGVDEPRDRACTVDTRLDGTSPQAVSVLEHDRAPVTELEQGLDVRRDRPADVLEVLRGGARFHGPSPVHAPADGDVP